jgi:hypothetical protein
VDVALSCSCGAFKGIAKDVDAKRGQRNICMCGDCQAFAHYLRRAPEILDENGGTEILPMYPSKIKFTHGAENLKMLRLTDLGMFRWYAGCCKTPIANTQVSAKLPFAGLVHSIIVLRNEPQKTEVLGPLRARVQSQDGIGKIPAGSHQKFALSFLFRVIRFLMRGVITKGYTPSPFFDSATGQPKAKADVLTFAEREVLRALCGPRP